MTLSDEMHTHPCDYCSCDVECDGDLQLTSSDGSTEPFCEPYDQTTKTDPWLCLGCTMKAEMEADVDDDDSPV